MKKIRKSDAFIAEMIKKTAGKMADISCGATSAWAMYQPTEPTMPKSRISKK